MPLPTATRALTLAVTLAVALALAGGVAVAGVPDIPHGTAGAPGVTRVESPEQERESLQEQAARLGKRLQEELQRLDRRLKGASEDAKRQLLEEQGTLQHLQEELTRRLQQLAEQSSEAWMAGARIFLDALERFLDGLQGPEKPQPSKPEAPPQIRET